MMFDVFFCSFGEFWSRDDCCSIANLWLPGRIGRIVLRNALLTQGIEVVAVNE